MTENQLEQPSHKFPHSANPQISKQIAQRLSKGQIITKQVYNQGTSQLKDDKHYSVLFAEFDFYQEMYTHMGWNLNFSAEGEFFYLSKVSDEDSVEEGDQNSLKICLPLFFMAESLVKRGFDTMVLWSPSVGLSDEDINFLSTDEGDAKITLEAIGYKGDVWQDAIKNLKAKGFIFENSKGHLVFSSAAKYFTERLIENFAK